MSVTLGSKEDIISLLEATLAAAKRGDVDAIAVVSHQATTHTKESVILPIAQLTGFIGAVSLMHRQLVDTMLEFDEQYADAMEKMMDNLDGTVKQ